MSVHKASVIFEVPRTTLRRKLKDESLPLINKTGPPPELGLELEKMLKDWILDSARKGFPLNKVSVLDSVAMLVQNGEIQTSFTNGRPGRKWYEGFLRRNKEITI